MRCAVHHAGAEIEPRGPVEGDDGDAKIAQAVGERRDRRARRAAGAGPEQRVDGGARRRPGAVRRHLADPERERAVPHQTGERRALTRHRGDPDRNVRPMEGAAKQLQY